ncbi:hypothetical protein RI129_009145 [Pyrocoelia pectoralis]|uniref:Ubiquitin carboxyl-terminal hydrolase n=1 Tax=Pyrocoelia pectoralis TaxID=417401 RepID=A0AAN7VCT5_9COLE
MPASTLDPVNAALRSALSKSTCSNTLDSQLAGSTKKALLSNIEFEPAGSYQSSVLDKLKSKYIVLKSSESTDISKQNYDKSENVVAAEEGFATAKRELYPLKSVQLGWNNADWSVGAGMVNMGNTCYLNSILQALFHVPALVNWLISEKQHSDECEDTGGSMCVICAMRKTLQDSQQRNINTIRPYLIYNKLRILCRNLIPGRQEDAHEFLRYLVEAMEKAYLSRFKNNSEFDSRIKETTPLNQILGGYLRSAVRCLECGNVSTTFQHFQDVLLDIRKAQTLDEALELYFSREKLDDDSYHCESSPMVLCIQLKRFSINSKISKQIQFRQRLDMTKYVRKRPVGPLIYKLVALVTHMGISVNCGHYTAIVQVPGGSFYQFDDSIVKPISNQAVFGTSAYIMLYELENSPFSPKSSKILSPISTITQIQEEIPTTTTSLNGNPKVYGPALPPNKFQNQYSLNSPNSKPATNENKCPKVPLALKTDSNNSKPAISSPNVSSTTNELCRSPVKDKSVPMTKLVPYDMDDSSNNSEESHSNVQKTCAITPADWKVSSSSDSAPEPSTEGSTWDKKTTNTVNELYQLSHNGYAFPVKTWNGTRSQLDKEVSNDRREARKRNITETEPCRTKHPKLNSNNTHNGNYNPVQEYHNSKNWTLTNGRYRTFYTLHKRHRNDHRIYHHKNFHKNHRFRR